jgi:hypothetical protein
LKEDPISHIANFTRMGWSAQNSTDWKNFTTAWAALYALYTDPLESTSTIKRKVRTFIKDFAAFAVKPISKSKASDDLVPEDGDIYHFVITKNPKTPHGAITAECYGTASAAGLGKLRLKAKTLSDAKRASKLKGADGVQFDYLICEAKAEPEIVGVPRVFPDEEYTEKFSKKASFIYDFGISNSGKIVQLFFRWYITGKPELSGPWCQMVIIRIP